MNYIDLFAGSGGLSLGLYNAGLDGVFAVEKSKDAFETLKYNLIDKKKHFSWPNWLEMRNWDINELLETHEDKLKTLRGSVDLIVGGPPCQGFSMAGKRKNNDVRNQLMHSYVNFVKLIQPEMLFFENVQGFTVDFKINDKIKNYSSILVENLESLGYIVNFQMIKMSDFGVPQNRKRFILFASKNPDDSKKFFRLLIEGKDKFLASKKIALPVTISEAIGDLNRKNGEVVSPDTKGFMNGIYGKTNSNYQKLMRKGIRKNNLPDSHRFAKHRESTIDLFTRLMKASEKQLRITPEMKLVEGLKKRGVTPLKANSV